MLWLTEFRNNVSIYLSTAEKLSIQKICFNYLFRTTTSEPNERGGKIRFQNIHYLLDSQSSRFTTTKKKNEIKINFQRKIFACIPRQVDKREWMSDSFAIFNKFLSNKFSFSSTLSLLWYAHFRTKSKLYNRKTASGESELFSRCFLGI